MEPADALARRRVVVAATLVVGTALLTWATRVEPGDALFYPVTLVLALTWAGGARLSGPVGWHATNRDRGAHPLTGGVLLGGGLLVLFLLGAVAVTRVPTLSDPVDQLLDHAREGSLPVVVVLTAVTGTAEEMFFRGSLYEALRDHRPVAVTTVLYAVSALGSGIWLLVLAAGLLGLVTALQRRGGSGVGAAVVTHLTWSLGMLLLLPLVLDALS
ncbi:putative integral membrane protein [Nostocoides japonicum T1-X7]|uniref:Putative integral membrane protein n=1 Tax=Nostocoides japonicum T1-X7 TaxID=1194083 RepID=A0A077LWK9_9MICO|nr:CPBP family glutamic-type intramembrane protease [Tetrasphaera japonica]CCH77192.1 putative integral membrane protein [Tetrasphaera japonica T1-X7]